MRGYEDIIGITVRERSGGYESPCGVMRHFSAQSRMMPLKLRIPMRGYEPEKLFIFVTCVYCYESPCGVMSASS